MKIITVVDDRGRASALEHSLNHFGWDYEIIQAPWRGFGTKLNQTYEYLMQKPDIERFIFLDGYDTFALGCPSEFKFEGQSLISTEINCWPDSERYQEYPHSYAKFKYANSGSYYMESELFKTLMENTNVRNDEDDQRIMTDWVLNHKLKLDYNKDVFLTLCGASLNKDYEIIGKKIITPQFTTPLFIHGNGKAEMSHINNLF